MHILLMVLIIGWDDARKLWWWLRESWNGSERMIWMVVMVMDMEACTVRDSKLIKSTNFSVVKVI